MTLPGVQRANRAASSPLDGPGLHPGGLVTSSSSCHVARILLSRPAPLPAHPEKHTKVRVFVPSAFSPSSLLS